MKETSQLYRCQSCNYNTHDKQLYIEHYMIENKHNISKNSIENQYRYVCLECNYNTDKKADFLKHIFTPKHLLRQNSVYNISKNNTYTNDDNFIKPMTNTIKPITNTIKPMTNIIKPTTNYICSLCNSQYKHQSSLSRHMKICKLKKYSSGKKQYQKPGGPALENKNNIKKNTKNNTSKRENHKMTSEKKICKFCSKEYKYASGLSRHLQNCSKKPMHTDSKSNDMHLSTSSKNEYGMHELLMKCFDMMTEQTQTMNKLIPNIGNNNNNTTTNKFNLNVYLNDTCKDAINLPEFVNNITLQFADLMSARKNGLLSSTTNVFLKELQSTEPVHRPIQCTDIKRKTMYIKEAGEWSKDIGNEKLKKAMSSISHKHMHLINDWKQKNPHHLDSEHGQEEFVKVIQSTTTDIKDDTRRLQSAVKEIGEIVHVVPPNDT